MCDSICEHVGPKKLIRADFASVTDWPRSDKVIDPTANVIKYDYEDEVIFLYYDPLRSFDENARIGKFVKSRFIKRFD